MLDISYTSISTRLMPCLMPPRFCGFCGWLILYQGTLILKICVILWTLSTPKIHLQTNRTFLHVWFFFAESFSSNPQVGRNSFNFLHLWGGGKSAPPPCCMAIGGYLLSEGIFIVFSNWDLAFKIVALRIFWKLMFLAKIQKSLV